MPVLEQALGTVRTFLRWWLAELAGMVPPALRRWTERGEGLVMVPDAHGVIALLEGPRGRRELGHVPPGGLAALARSAGWRGGPVRLRLPAESGLRLPMQLPLAAEANLAEVIGFELDQQTPFRPEQVRLGHRLVGRDAAAQRLTLELTLVPRPAVDAALDRARALGVEPDAVEVVRGSGGADGLSVPGLDGEGGAARDPLAVGLGALAALLAVAAVALPLLRAHGEAEEARAAFEAVRRQSQATAGLAAELARIEGEAAFLVGRKQAAPTVSDLLLEVTRLLPDEAWLTSFEVADGQVRLSGLAASASGLVGLMEGSGLFRDTTFQAPVVQDPKTGRERFSLSARVVAEGGA